MSFKSRGNKTGRLLDEEFAAVYARLSAVEAAWDTLEDRVAALEGDTTPPPPSGGIIIYGANSFDEFTTITPSGGGTYGMATHPDGLETMRCELASGSGNSAVRCVHKGNEQIQIDNLPDDMYAGVWCHIEALSDCKFWNPFQCKRRNGNTSNKMWSASFFPRSDGTFGFRANTDVDQTNGVFHGGNNLGDKTATVGVVPIGEWFHMEMHYVWCRGVGDGRFTFRLNGEELWDLTDIYTETDTPLGGQPARQCTPSVYGSETVPANPVAWLRDFTVATDWVGP